MRSAVPHEFIDPQSEPQLVLPAIGKWLHRCRTCLEHLTGRVKQLLDTAPECTSASIATAYSEFATDDFDWCLNELAYREGQYCYLTTRAWKRHGAILTLARDVSLQTHFQDDDTCK